MVKAALVVIWLAVASYGIGHFVGEVPEGMGEARRMHFEFIDDAVTLCLRKTGKGQEALDDSATRSVRRKVGSSGVGFDDGEEPSCAPIESAALALWAARHATQDPTFEPEIG